MERRLATVEMSRPSRLRLLGLLALWFVAAQLFFAAHLGVPSDPLINHTPSACEFCLAGATADDPTLLVAVLAPPTPIYLESARPSDWTTTPGPLRLTARSRAPPFC